MGHQSAQYQVRSALLKNDSQVASGSETGELFIWDLLSANTLHRHPLHRAGISCVAWHEASGSLLTCSIDGSCTTVMVQ